VSYYLLAKPREAFARTIEERVATRRDRSQTLGARLEGDDPAAPAADAEPPLPPGVSEAPARGRAKRR
jgi:hypothetical protein